MAIHPQRQEQPVEEVPHAVQLLGDGGIQPVCSAELEVHWTRKGPQALAEARGRFRFLPVSLNSSLSLHVLFRFRTAVGILVEVSKRSMVYLSEVLPTGPETGQPVSEFSMVAEGLGLSVLKGCILKMRQTSHHDSEVHQTLSRLFPPHTLPSRTEGASRRQTHFCFIYKVLS